MCKHGIVHWKLINIIWVLNTFMQFTGDFFLGVLTSAERCFACAIVFQSFLLRLKSVPIWSQYDQTTSIAWVKRYVCQILQEPLHRSNIREWEDRYLEAQILEEWPVLRLNILNRSICIGEQQISIREAKTKNLKQVKKLSNKSKMCFEELLLLVFALPLAS